MLTDESLGLSLKFHEFKGKYIALHLGSLSSRIYLGSARGGRKSTVIQALILGHALRSWDPARSSGPIHPESQDSSGYIHMHFREAGY